jgi:hypothetical protein
MVLLGLVICKQSSRAQRHGHRKQRSESVASQGEHTCTGRHANHALTTTSPQGNRALLVQPAAGTALPYPECCWRSISVEHGV